MSVLEDIPMLVHLDNPHDIATAMGVRYTEEKEAQHATGNTWPLPALGTELTQSNNPAEIVPLDSLRKRAVIFLNGSGQVIICHSEGQAQSMQQNVQQAADEGCLITCPAVFVYESTAPLWAVAVPSATSGNSVGAKGSVTGPAGGTIIASISSANLVVGQTYQVDVYVYLDGTIVAGTDDDNMAFRFGGTTISPLVVPGGVDVPVKSTYIVTVVSANTLNVIAVGAASASAVYHAQIVATPFPFTVSTGAVQVGTLTERRDS